MSSKQQSVPWLNSPLEIHLDPFTMNGKTFRVFGTRTEPDHAHHVLCIETDERWWIPHDRVKAAQTANV